MSPLDPERIFGLSSAIRYVAIYTDGRLVTGARPGRENASSSESDRYEELFVNPTLLTLTTQRGRIDCGGLDYVLVRYGSFFQVVVPGRGGHVSVCVEPDGDVLNIAVQVQRLTRETS